VRLSSVQSAADLSLPADESAQPWWHHEVLLPANGVVDERVEVLAPCFAGRRRADHVFQQHIPTNDERPQLAHAHITASE